MTDEHKQKLREGRAKAALARKEAKNLNPADLPAGDERREARSRVKDHLDETIERQMADTETEPIDESKLRKPIDNEVGRYTQSAGVQNEDPRYVYIRLPSASHYRSFGAQANIRDMHNTAKAFGFKPVQGDDREDKRYEGNDAAAGTSLRGVADTILYKMPRDVYERKVAEGNARANAKWGQVEQDLVRFAERGGFGGQAHGIAGDFSQDPLMNRVAGPAGRIETYRRQPAAVMKTTFNEGDMRRGSIPGIPAPGARS